MTETSTIDWEQRCLEAERQTRDLADHLVNVINMQLINNVPDAKPLGYLCEDLRLKGEISFIRNADHAATRMKMTKDWRVIALFDRPSVPQPTHGWVVCDGGEGDDRRYRMWGDSGPEWTGNQDDAIHFARRKDAEDFCREDEDAMQILNLELPAG